MTVRVPVVAASMTVLLMVLVSPADARTLPPPDDAADLGQLVRGSQGRTTIEVVGTDGVVASTTIGAVMRPRSLSVGPDGTRLYVAVGTNTHVLDLTDPRQPVLLGRMTDYMVRNHESVQTLTVDNLLLGSRDLLLIGSRLGGGGGCWTGTVHIYDATGALRDAPVDVLDSDVPPAGPGGSCATAALSIDGPSRRLSLTWSSSDEGAAGSGLRRRDTVNYDITAAFAARVGVCPLVI